MPLLDTIKQMQQQGLSEQKIIQNLREAGYNPLEISQVLDQSKIKAAIREQETQEQYTDNFQPSLIESQEPNISETQQAEEYPPQQTTPEYIYPTPQAYSEYQEYQPYSSSETSTEIAEQITDEKLMNVREDIASLKSFQTTAERKISLLDERLKKIEMIIDKLQSSILGRIGEYGQDMQDIKKEMGMMQESFSKALNPLIDKSREKISQESRQQAKTRKKSDGFEHYLRR